MNKKNIEKRISELEKEINLLKRVKELEDEVQRLKKYNPITIPYIPYIPYHTYPWNPWVTPYSITNATSTEITAGEFSIYAQNN